MNNSKYFDKVYPLCEVNFTAAQKGQMKKIRLNEILITIFFSFGPSKPPQNLYKLKNKLYLQVEDTLDTTLKESLQSYNPNPKNNTNSIVNIAWDGVQRWVSIYFTYIMMSPAARREWQLGEIFNVMCVVYDNKLRKGSSTVKVLSTIFL